MNEQNNLGKFVLAPSSLIRIGLGLLDRGYEYNEEVEVECYSCDIAESGEDPKFTLGYLMPLKKNE